MATRGTNQIALTVGANLRAARAARQMTQHQVATELGVTSRDISRWETGGVEPGAKYRHDLATLFFDGDVSALYSDPERAAA